MRPAPDSPAAFSAREAMSDRRDVSRPLRIAASLGLFALAVGVRALPWRQVLTDQRVYFFGNDAYYHLRRIVYSVARFPDVLRFDPYINYPRGAKPIWSPGFDWTLAAVGRLFVHDLTGPGLAALERFLVWVPPVLGGVAVLTAVGLARRHFGRAEAWAGGLVLALLSAHFWYSQIGFVDHHVAVAWLSTLAVAAAMALLDAHREGRTARLGTLAVATGAALAAGLLVWPGTLLHLGFVELGFLAALLACPGPGEARRLAWALAALHAVAAAAVAPFSWGNVWPQWSETSPVVLSRFQPWLLGTAALGAAGCALLWRADRFGATRARRAASLGASAAILLGVSALWLPDLAAGLGDAVKWLAKDEAFQGIVSESEGLFEQEGRFTTLVALVRFGPFVFVYPLALAALLVAGRRDPARWLFVAWAAGLFAVTLLQRRFFNTASVGYALVLGVALCHAARALPARWPRIPRTGARWAVAGLGVILLLPVTRPYLRWIDNEVRAARGEKLTAPPSLGAALAGFEVAAWLYQETPPTRGWLQPALRPEYGVLAPWHLGHLIKYVGRRPTVVDNFGDDVGAESFAWARRYYLSTEAEMAPEMEARGIRYVVAQATSRFLPEHPGVGTLFHSLYFLDGSRFVPAPGVPVPEAPALERHRLVYESQPARFTDPDAPSLYKIYEFVKGARVEGRARPGAEVDVEIGLRTNRRRRIVWRTAAVADRAGLYRVTLPYATLGGPRGPQHVRAQNFYRFSCGDEQRRFAVGERAVRTGRALRGPPLCADGPSPAAVGRAAGGPASLPGNGVAR